MRTAQVRSKQGLQNDMCSLWCKLYFGIVKQTPVSILSITDLHAMQQYCMEPSPPTITSSAPMECHCSTVLHKLLHPPVPLQRISQRALVAGLQQNPCLLAVYVA